jgi:formylglycine-generating enzyme required for sulfatase activity
LPGGHAFAWEDDARPITQPWVWDQEQFNQPSQPVVGVSWYEAVAYAAWLTLQGHTYDWLPPEAVIRLPTWREWQRTTRHTDRRRYPWGDTAPTAEHANWEAAGLETPSPVGCFPAGQAACGAFDMAGNVWEWIATRQDTREERLPMQDAAQDEAIVVAGGAYPNDKGHLRCGAQSWDDPCSRTFNQGFRVIWSPRSLI